MAATFEGFQSIDFEVFTEDRSRSETFNEKRLETKRRLAALGDHCRPILSAAGLDLPRRTSLHHPFSTNRFRVQSMWLYFARGADRLAELKSVLGPAFSEDLDPHYTHLLLVAEINAQEIKVGLRIHANAWWEGQNWKQKCGRSGEIGRCLNLLNQIPDSFEIRLHNWAHIDRCGSVRKDDLGNFLRRYQPGEHWATVQRTYSQEEAIELGSSFEETLANDLVRLVPIYKYIAWSKKNNHLFSV